LDSHSFRHGQRKLVRGRVDSATVIEIGDMVWLDTDDVKPASDFTWNSNLATTQGDFAAKFLGIASEKSANGDTDPISVDVSEHAIYEFTVASATYEIGDDLGPDDDTTPSPDELMDQQLVGTSAATSAIARSHEYKASASTKLLVSFYSAYYGSNINANVG
jgi:hypothetical protein